MLLGKRKRRVSVSEVQSQDIRVDGDVDRNDQYRSLLQKHFENTYEPLEDGFAFKDDHIDSNDGREDSSGNDWDGFSDDDPVSDDAVPSVPVIDHSSTAERIEDETLAEARKSFMNARLPGDDAVRALRNVKAAPEDKDPTSEAALLKNDMALQRLLRESKLLSSSSATQDEASLRLTGRSRHQALDVQLRSLGAKASIHAQKSMPRSQRMGIVRTAAEKEKTRRKEAKEAGIVLEKEQRAPRDAKRRDRGIGAPGIGKFRGGTLTLSAKDIRSIQGPPATKKRGKTRR